MPVIETHVTAQSEQDAITSEASTVEEDEAVGPEVAIIVAPFASVLFPSLEAGMAHTVCANAGWTPNTIYLNQWFADFIGAEAYFSVSSIQRSVGVAEWVGAASLRDLQPEVPADTVAVQRYPSMGDYLVEEHEFTPADWEGFENIATYVEPFIQQVVDEVEWDRFPVILLCCKHQQLGMSASLARAIREKAPDVKLYLFGEMVNGVSESRAALTHFPWIDGVLVRSPVCLGGDRLDRLRRGEPVAGAMVRGPEETFLFEELAAIDRLGPTTIAPTYDTFYEQFVSDSTETVLPYQTSHGCAWADRSHCSFCGLIEENQRHISKSGDQVIDELVRLIEEHETLRVVTADLLLDDTYFDTVIPRLTELDLDLTIFFEVRANLRKDQIRQLRDAGINNLQVGIESFDTRVLKGMGKGTTALQNIRMLKWCAELGVNMSWIYLFGFPEDSPQSLGQQAEINRRLWHLQPPISVTTVRTERNSPMQLDPARFGTIIRSPSEPYLHTYPWPLASLMDLAKEFRHDYLSGRDAKAEAKELIQAVEAWRAAWKPNMLYYMRGANFIKVCDFRRKEHVITLRGWRAALYLAIDDYNNAGQIRAQLRAQGYTVSDDEIATALQTLDNLELVIEDHGRWLALAPRVDRNYLLRRGLESDSSFAKLKSNER